MSTAPAPTTAAAEVVSTFLELLNLDDVDGVAALLAEDVEWRNSKAPTIRGPRVVGALKKSVNAGIGVDITVHHLAADGDTVLTDRTDVITWGRWQTSFWVAGTFTVRDGRITVWDDRFSIGSFVGGSVVGLFGLLRRSSG